MQTTRNLARLWTEGEHGAWWEAKGRRLGRGMQRNRTTTDVEKQARAAELYGEGLCSRAGAALGIGMW